MTIFALYNLKGGVGKTAATVNLAYLASQEGYSTIVWDLDPQAAASYYFDVTPAVKNQNKKILTGEIELEETIQPTAYENLAFIPADFSMRNADVILYNMKQSKKKFGALFSELKKENQLLFLDCPPGLSSLHESIFYIANWILMPNIPTTLSVRSFEMVMNYCTEHNIHPSKIKAFFSMVDHRKNLHHETMQQFQKDKMFLKNYIPYLSDVEKMGIHHAPVEVFAPSSYAAECYRSLWKEIKKQCLV